MGPPPRHSEQDKSNQQPRRKPQECEPHRLLDNQGLEISIAKSNRFQRGIFGQMMLHIGIKNLVKNHRAYQHHHEQRDGDDEADRRTPIPISLLRLHQLFFRKDEHLRAKLSLEAVAHLLWISIPPKPNKPQGFGVRRQNGEDAIKSYLRQQNLAIGSERDPKLESPPHVTVLPIDLDRARLMAGHPALDIAKLR